MEVNIRDLGHDGVVLEVVASLYGSESFCDVIFHCGDKEDLKAHRLLLASVSPMLQNIFLDQPPYVTVEIALPDIKSQILENLLRFLYEGCVRLSKDEVCGFEELISMLGISVSYTGTSDDEEKVIPISKSFKRKLVPEEEENEGRTSKQKCNNAQTEHHATITSINSILKDLTKKSTVPNSERRTGGPTLVPLERFESAVITVERARAEKRLYSIVENLIKHHMKSMLIEYKECKRRRKTSLPEQMPLKSGPDQQSCKDSASAIDCGSGIGANLLKSPQASRKQESLETRPDIKSFKKAPATTNGVPKHAVYILKPQQSPPPIQLPLECGPAVQSPKKGLLSSSSRSLTVADLSKPQTMLSSSPRTYLSESKCEDMAQSSLFHDHGYSFTTK